MRNSKIISLLQLISALTMLIIMTGCEKDGAIRLINRTSFPIYAGISGTEYTVQAGQSKSIDVTTPTSTPFNPDVDKKVIMSLIGETYMIYDDYEEEFINQTTLHVKPGKTTNVYVDPNRASVKVRNLSDSLITQVIVERHEAQNTYYNTYNVNIPIETEWYQPIQPATVNNQFYLRVRVVFSGGEQYQYGDENTIKEKDEQFLITVLPSTRK